MKNMKFFDIFFLHELPVLHGLNTHFVLRFGFEKLLIRCFIHQGFKLRRVRGLDLNQPAIAVSIGLQYIRSIRKPIR